MPRKRKGKRKHHGMPKGFVSKKQWRYFFVNPRLRRYARKEAHKTPGGPVIRYRRLPLRKTAPGVRSAFGAAKKKRR